MFDEAELSIYEEMCHDVTIEEKQPAARAAPVQPQQPIDFSALWDEYYRSVGNKK